MLAMFTAGAGSCAYALNGNAQTGPVSDKPNRCYEMGYERTFASAVKAAKGMGIGIQREYPYVGVIETAKTPVPIKGDCDCRVWHGSEAVGYARAVLIIDIKKLSDTRTQVVLNVHLATGLRGGSQQGVVYERHTYPCYSTGAIEDRYFASLDRSIGQVGRYYGEKPVQVRATSSEPDRDSARLLMNDTKRKAALPTPPARKQEKNGAKQQNASKSPDEPGGGQSKAKPLKRDAKPKSVTRSEDAVQGKTGPEPGRLQRLESLKAMGLISEAEFQAEAAKKK